MKSQLEAAMDTEPRLEMQDHHTHTRDHAHAHANAPIHRPIPRRTLNTAHLDTAQHTETAQTQTQTHPNASLPTSRSSDFLAQLNARLLRANTYASPPDTQNSPTSPSSTLPRQNKSFTSLARASTLQGVYDDVTESQSVVSTPWGNGAETPAHGVMGLNMPHLPRGSSRGSAAAQKQNTQATGMAMRRRRSSHAPHARKTRIARYAVQAAKIAALAVFGVCYGLLVRYLHGTRQLAAVFRVRRGEARGARWGGVDVLVWGLAGVVLGCALPAVDGVWRERSERGVGQKKGCKDKDRSGEVEGEKEEEGKNGDAEIEIEIPISEQINDVVRSVAAFVGIAFAIVSPPLTPPTHTHTSS